MIGRKQQMAGRQGMGAGEQDPMADLMGLTYGTQSPRTFSPEELWGMPYEEDYKPRGGSFTDYLFDLMRAQGQALNTGPTAEPMSEEEIRRLLESLMVQPGQPGQPELERRLPQEGDLLPYR